MSFTSSFTVPAVAAIGFCLIGGTSPASAGTIYDNGPPDGVQGLSNILSAGLDRRLADDFILAGGPGWIVHNVEMNYIWSSIGIDGASDVRVTFYADDAGGGPGTIISDQVSSHFTETLTDISFFNRPEVIFSIGIAPVSLAADTTYWVAIQPNGVENGFQLTSATGARNLNGDQVWVRYPDITGPDYAPGNVVFSEFYDVVFRLNGKAVPAPCPWDLDGSGSVGATDLLALLAAWGVCDDPANCPADFDNTNDVGTVDLLALLVNWGPCP